MTAPPPGPLARHLAELIDLQGPIPVSVYMAEVLGHPQFGYYMNREPFGREGDFVTAPEVSQMFGELIGIWCADAWQRMGAPGHYHLIELGPGKGTLMADLIRALRTIPGAVEGAEIHLIETSPRLADQQRETLTRAGIDNAVWHERLSAVPEGPTLLVANEFFDALPVRQFVNTTAGWCERLVNLKPGANTFEFVVAAQPSQDKDILPPEVLGAPEGSIAETCPVAQALVIDIAERISTSDGAALMIDYGAAQSAPGDSLQAVRGHQYFPVLGSPGEADLTAHVDFAALARAAESVGVATHGPLEQGQFLKALGIDLRASALERSATPEQTADMKTALDRLTAPDQMGTLFKVLALTRHDQMPPAGFDTP